MGRALGEKEKLEVISQFSCMSWVPSLVLVIFDGKTINLYKYFRIKGKLCVMNKTLLVSLISSIHLFLFGGSWDTCLAQELRSEVRQSTNAVEGLKVFPSVDKVLIEWSVDQPISNVNFILERKGQEGYYEIVAAIKSTRQLSYTLVDSDPPTRGTVVYRIRQQERGT